MLDKIQFLLSLQIIGFCIFGGATLLLRAGDNPGEKDIRVGYVFVGFSGCNKVVCESLTA